MLSKDIIGSLVFDIWRLKEVLEIECTCTGMTQCKDCWLEECLKRFEKELTKIATDGSRLTNPLR